MAKNSLISLAKGRSSTKVTAEKNKPVDVKNKTPEEIRDIKAKQKVEELLSDVNMSYTTSVETPPNVIRVKEGIEWFEQELEMLTKENEKLKQETFEAKTEYEKIFTAYQHLKGGGGHVDEEDIKNSIVRLFSEIQENYITMGIDPVKRVPNLVLPPVAFMNRMIMFFPFLERHKKF